MTDVIVDNKFNEFQTKWLEALESGEYDQCKNQLYDKDRGYCCLGVAEKLRDPDMRLLDHGSEIGTPSCHTRSKLNLFSPTGFLKDPNYNSLTDLNDDHDFSFNDIAEYIRKEPWRVFGNFEKPS